MPPRRHHTLALPILLAFLPLTACDSIRPGDDRAGKNCERITQLAEELCVDASDGINVACLEGGGWELGGYPDIARPACWTEIVVCSAAIEAAADECTEHRGSVRAYTPDMDRAPLPQCCNDSGQDCEELQWGCY